MYAGHLSVCVKRVCEQMNGSCILTFSFWHICHLVLFTAGQYAVLPFSFYLQANTNIICSDIFTYTCTIFQQESRWFNWLVTVFCVDAFFTCNKHDSQCRQVNNICSFHEHKQTFKHTNLYLYIFFRYKCVWVLSNIDLILQPLRLFCRLFWL